MDVVIDSGKFQPAAIVQVNRCRLFLQALTLADIVNIRGDRLDPNQREGQIPTDRALRHIPVHQESPNPAAWSQWRKLMDIVSGGGVLRRPLGRWLLPPSQLRYRWLTYYCAATGLAYSPSDGDSPTLAWTPANEGTSIPSSVACVPDTAFPVERLGSGFGPVDLTNPGLRHAGASNSGPYSTISDYSQVRNGFHRLFPPEHVHFPSQGHLDGVTDILVATDGGVRNSVGGFGWVVSTPTRTVLGKGSGPVMGSNPTSYRAELHGILSALLLTGWMEKVRGRPFGAVTIICDSQSAIKAAQSVTLAGDNSSRRTVRALHPLVPDWDLLIEARQVSASVGSTVGYEYVRSHQDAGTTRASLPHLAQLNCLADELATSYVLAHGPAVTSPLFPNTSASLVTPDGSIHSAYPAVLRYRLSAPALHQAARDKFGWTDSVYASIDQRAFKAFVAQGRRRPQHTCKLAYGILPTLAALTRRGERHSPVCAQCGLATEDFVHILRCGHPVRQRWRVSLLRHLRRVLDEHGADPGVRDLLIDGLGAWLQGGSLPLEQCPARLHLLLCSQSDIGWQHLFTGRVSRLWSTAGGDPMHPDRLARGSREGPSLGVLLATTILPHWASLWDLRNGNLHGADAAAKRAKVRAAVSERIHHIYSRREEYLPADRRLLRDTAADHVDHSTTAALQRWLAVHAGMFHRSAIAAAQYAVAGVQAIWTFFPSR